MTVALPRRPPMLLRVVRARARLFASAAVAGGVVIALTALTDCRPFTRGLAGWDVGVALYLVLAAHGMARSGTDMIRVRAAEQDEGQLVMLVLTVTAALASLAAIFGELAGTAAAGAVARRPAGVALAGGTVFLSWLFIHVIFAFHYAHEFYDARTPGGLAFPDRDAEPDYWDFIYFSFVIGMTSQVSDVAVTSKPMRRMVTAHGVLAFVFNVALLALTINLAAQAF
jgi:uncharacterized membrane protein